MKKWGVHAAVWLATESLPLFPCFCTGSKLATRAFRSEGRIREFCWPVWGKPVSLAALKSLLASADLIDPDTLVHCELAASMAFSEAGNLNRTNTWSAFSRPYFPREARTYMRTTYLVCYDICDDKRLKKVFKTMRNYGDHLQYSVFECQMTATDLVRCRTELAAHHQTYEDQVLFVNLGPAEGRGDRVITAMGMPYTAIDAPCIIV